MSISDPKKHSIFSLSFFGLTMILIMWFYCKSISALNNHSEMIVMITQIKKRDLYVYAFLPLIAFGPSGINDALSAVFGLDIVGLSMFSNIILGLSGFMNATVYFFQRFKSGNGNKISLECVESQWEGNLNKESLDRLSLYSDFTD